jgi:hypothetical protein
MVSMRDGVRLNTFVFVPESAREPVPVIVQRTPYGITSPEGQAVTDPTRGWLPDPARPFYGPLLRGWQRIVEHGYAAVYQDCRGRFGSEGLDRVYFDDAEDGYDLLEWIAAQGWSDGNVGLSGSSAAGIAALAAASRRHPSVRAFFTQVAASSLYDDVVYEGASIEMERLWLWVANNTAGVSPTHRSAVAERAGMAVEDLAPAFASVRRRYAELVESRDSEKPFVRSQEWMQLPLVGDPDFSVLQPHLDQILSHPVPDAFRRHHDFRASIDVPGFHVTSWFDVFLPSVLAAYQEIQDRIGNQRLWIGPNAHGFVYESQFWPFDPYFAWFDHWLRGAPDRFADEPRVYYSPRAWVDDAQEYRADDWRGSQTWPPADGAAARWRLCGDATLTPGDADATADDRPRRFTYDPRQPVPSAGGRNMLIASGMIDQRGVRRHPNYGLTYSGDVLDAPVTIAGPVTVTLSVESDCPDTDFVVKVVEARPDGQALLLMDGVVRAMYRSGGPAAEPLTPGQIVELTIELGHLHHTVQAGSRLEIDVTSSNFPRRIRNTNSSHPMLAADTEADIRVAQNTVHHSAEHPSFLQAHIVVEPTSSAVGRAVGRGEARGR